MGIKITGTGYYVPERILTNSDLEGMVETSDEWIVTRTGIRERHIAGEGTITSDLAARAGERAIESAGIRREDIDLLIVSTMTPDMATPSTAAFVQRKLGLRPCMCLDIEAACTGLLYGLDIVHAMLASGQRRTALLIGAERMSSVTNWQDRTPCVLFGDGAGAVVVGARLFGEMLRRMPDGMVTLTVDEKDNVNVKCGRSEFNFMGISCEDYPEMPIVDGLNNISLPQKILKSMINQTIF